MRKAAGIALFGLVILFAVVSWARPGEPAAATRVYFVAAEEVDWDYAPGGNDAISGQPFQGLQLMLTTAAEDRIGKVYRKAIYREYTDSTFSTRKPRPPEWEHLGLLGPVIRAAVGDTIKVVFRNLATRPYSMHPHGVFYNKDSEGAPYNDGRTGAEEADDAVAPGGTFTYLWPVPERAGPAHGEGSTAFWM
jgi:hephaestin